MSSLHDVISAWGLPSATTQKLETWLSHPDRGWDLTEPPDEAFYTIGEEDLVQAGLATVKERRSVLAKLKPPAGSSDVAALRKEVQELRASADAARASADAALSTIDAALSLVKVAALLIDWTEDQASASSVADFKDELIFRYSKTLRSSDGPLIYCMLTHEYLPRNVVIASHLWKCAWWKYMEVVGMEDINDPRNGLLLAKPIKWAFDTSQICFIYDRRFDHYTALLLNRALANIRLADKLEELLQGRNMDRRIFARVHQTYGDKTFEWLEGRWLQSAQLKVDVFGRMLFLHAKRAPLRAREQGWIDELPDIPDCSSEGSWQERIKLLMLNIEDEQG